MSELKVPVSKEDYWKLRAGRLYKYPLPTERVASLYDEFPDGKIDFDKVRFIYGSRNFLRDFEGIQYGQVYVGDKT